VINISQLTQIVGFRHGWYHHGFTKEQLPYQAAFGIYGSWIGFILCGIAIAATFYTSLFPLHSSPDAEVFFENFLAAPLVIALYLGWKIYSREWRMFVPVSEMNVTTGIRRGTLEMAVEKGRTGWMKALRVFI
jgi:yeast amino acid transporter